MLIVYFSKCITIILLTIFNMIWYYNNHIIYMDTGEADHRYI